MAGTWTASAVLLRLIIGACACFTLACVAAMIGVAAAKCDFNCTKDTPGAELQDNGMYRCDGAQPGRFESWDSILTI